MTTTVGELIERLKKMDRDEVVLCNLYSVANLRDCILGYCKKCDALDGMTDGEVLGKFCRSYDFDEDEAFWRAGREVSESLDGRG